LATTTIKTPVLVSDTAVCVASTTGITPGLGLFVDQELMSVVSLGLPSLGGTNVNVLRGRGGSATQQHSSGATVYIGQQDQFYSAPPVGAPGQSVLVTPYIDVVAGKVYYPQGDELPTYKGNTTYTHRWWQEVTNTPGYGALGIRTTTQTPPTSN
jgi:hypothetical protein